MAQVKYIIFSTHKLNLVAEPLVFPLAVRCAPIGFWTRLPWTHIVETLALVAAPQSGNDSELLEYSPSVGSVAY
jgi:hypothetical protein